MNAALPIRPARSEPWFFTFGPPPETAQVTLVCLPCAGGSAAMYRGWAQSLPDGVALMTVRLPGRESRLDEPAHTAMDRFVTDFVPILRRVARHRYALFGHSMGALMIYALLRHRPADVPLPDAVFLSAHRPPHLDLGRPPIHGLPKAGFLDAVRAMGGLPDEVWTHSELLNLLEPTMRADFALCETYPRGLEAHQDTPIAPPAYVFGGNHDESATPDALKQWADLCGDFRGLHLHEGGHFYLRAHETALLAQVFGALTAAAPIRRSPL